MPVEQIGGVSPTTASFLNNQSDNTTRLALGKLEAQTNLALQGQQNASNWWMQQQGNANQQSLQGNALASQERMQGRSNNLSLEMQRRDNEFGLHMRSLIDANEKERLLMNQEFAKQIGGDLPTRMKYMNEYFDKQYASEMKGHTLSMAEKLFVFGALSRKLGQQGADPQQLALKIMQSRKNLQAQKTLAKDLTEDGEMIGRMMAVDGFGRDMDDPAAEYSINRIFGKLGGYAKDTQALIRDIKAGKLGDVMELSKDLWRARSVADFLKNIDASKLEGIYWKGRDKGSKGDASWGVQQALSAAQRIKATVLQLESAMKQAGIAPINLDANEMEVGLLEKALESSGGNYEGFSDQLFNILPQMLEGMGVNIMSDSEAVRKRFGGMQSPMAALWGRGG